MESPFFFPNGDYRLFGCLHTPDPNEGPARSRHAGVVFCEPFAEEKLISHRTMVNLARSLAAESIPVFRFDSMGHGDSEGNFEDSTVDSRLSDIRCAVELFRRRAGVEKIILLGVRFGATLAALAASGSVLIDSLVLISPVINGQTYMEQCLRSSLATQMAVYKKIEKNRKQLLEELDQGQPVNIDGYLVSKALYEQICAIDLLASPVRSERGILIVQVSEKEGKPVEEGLQHLHDFYRSQVPGVQMESVADGEFWKDGKVYHPAQKRMTSKVLDWVGKAYSA